VRHARGRLARRLVALLALTLLMGGCRLSQLGHLQFSKDTRLHFTAPAERSLVTVPLTVSWQVRGSPKTAAGGAPGEYVVFIDLAPVEVGRTLEDVGKDDPHCRRDPTCPDTAYLAGRGVYPTTQTSVTVDQLPRAPKGVGDEQHEATVILLDGAGVRRTESAWHIEFRYPRRSV